MIQKLMHEEPMIPDTFSLFSKRHLNAASLLWTFQNLSITLSSAEATTSCTLGQCSYGTQFWIPPQTIWENPGDRKANDQVSKSMIYEEISVSCLVWDKADMIQFMWDKWKRTAVISSRHLLLRRQDLAAFNFSKKLRGKSEQIVREVCEGAITEGV